ncbi:MAG: adenosylcobinamide-phosphate guanylyltransferase [Halobacteriales archaeon]|jgi:adenosylcobinamide-phosphate guanylyltransferase
MCGGPGTRLDADVEKPLFEVGGEPMVDRVRRALGGSRIDRGHAVVSPHTPDTRDYLDGTLPLIETPGEGYVADLDVALDRVETPVLTVAADLPLLDPAVVDRVLDAYDRGGSTGSMTVVVPAALKDRLDASCDTVVRAEDVPAAFDDRGEGGMDGNGNEDGFACDLAPTGVNVVADAQEDTMYLSYDARLAVNVNRQSDAALAEALRCE